MGQSSSLTIVVLCISANHIGGYERVWVTSRLAHGWAGHSAYLAAVSGSPFHVYILNAGLTPKIHLLHYCAVFSCIKACERFLSRKITPQPFNSIASNYIHEESSYRIAGQFYKTRIWEYERFSYHVPSRGRIASCMHCTLTALGLQFACNGGRRKLQPNIQLLFELYRGLFG